MAMAMLKVLSGLAAKLRRRTESWRNLNQNHRFEVGDHVRTRRGTTGVVCHIGAGHDDNLHIWLDNKRRPRARICKRPDVIGWLPADSRSAEALDKADEARSWSYLGPCG